MTLYHYLRQHGVIHTAKRLRHRIVQARGLPPAPPTTYAKTYTWEKWRTRSPWKWPTTKISNWLKAHIDLADVLESANHIQQGKFLCWNHQWIDFTHDGQVCWVRDPLTGYRWPNQQTTLPKVPGTDIKTVWEASRMDWTGHLIRAWLMTEDPQWPAQWWTLLEHWHAQPDHDVHWSNGQEIAIRALNMLWGAHILPDHVPFSRFEQWCHNMAHAIAWHHPHTRIAINNNHVILEAVALFSLSLAFPRWPKAAIWQAMAQQSLLDALRTQWRGQYIQRSHSYHRLALWALMWVRPQVHNALKDAIDRTLAGAHTTLTSQQGKRHGRLPCFGPNDGACWPNIHTCDYRDYRPVIQCLRALTQENIHSDGPWAEAILWMTGTLEANVPGTFASNVPVISELTTLRHNHSTFATMIHGPFFGPFGQDDQMHVDLTWQGHDVTLDRGSYRYTGFAQAHHQHHGARGHNTVTIEQMGSRWMAGYFSWRNPERTTVEVTQDVSRGSWCQAHRRGFVRAPQTSHTRKLVMIDGGWEIHDTLEVLSTSCQLRWILPHGDWSNDPRETSFILNTDDLTIALTLEIIRGKLVDMVIQPTSWSPYYGDQLPAMEWVCTIEPEGDTAHWTTTILPAAYPAN